MIAILGFLIGGVLVGWLLRARRFTFLGRILSVVVLLLLFSLGIEIGSSPDVMQNLPSLGGSAVVIALFSILGSVLLAWLLYKYVTRKEKK